MVVGSALVGALQQSLDKSGKAGRGTVKAVTSVVSALAEGLRSARNALTPDGLLAIWSAGADPAFTRRLEKARFHVDEVKVAARSNGKGPKHVIWFASPQ